jgi:hypothetical protein
MEDTEATNRDACQSMNEAADSTARLLMYLRQRGDVERHRLLWMARLRFELVNSRESDRIAA